MKLPLPSDTRSILENNNVLSKTSNLSLLFNKYVYSWQNGWQMKEEDSKKFRQSIANMTFVKEHIDNLALRRKAMLQALQSYGWHIISFTATTDSRLIIGLGGTSVIETGMTLHPLYGFPYLPGSGMKGLARAYAEIGADALKEELLAIFGSEDKAQHSENNRQGKVFFMDALPTTFPKLELDIMNPHYGEYYRGEKPPADYLNPVPVTFLAIAAGQTFSFAVLSRDKTLAEKAKLWLINGLTDLGAGGKTNVGYGYFRIELSKTDPVIDPPKTTLTETWENATLVWTPGNQTLKATKDNQKAELKVKDKTMIPAEYHEMLFDKRKSVTANVTLEKIGNAFKIISIS